MGALSCSSGETLVYNFSTKPSRLSSTQKSLLKQEYDRMEQRENYFVSSVAAASSPARNSPIRSPVQSSSPLVPKVATPPPQKERKSKPKSPRNTEAAPTFSWTKFFINANIDKGSAKKYAAFFEGE